MSIDREEQIIEAAEREEAAEAEMATSLIRITQFPEIIENHLRHFCINVVSAKRP